METWIQSNFAGIAAEDAGLLRILAPEDMDAVPEGTELWLSLEPEDTVWLAVEGADAAGPGLLIAERMDGSCVIGILPGTDREAAAADLTRLHAVRQAYPAPFTLLRDRTDGDGCISRLA